MTISIRTETDEMDPNKHIVLPAGGGTDVLGVVFDEQGAIPSRGRFAAWSPKAHTRKNIAGFFDTLDEAATAIGALYDAPAEPAPPKDTDPTWRTLKGVTAPFTVYAHETGGRLHPAGDRTQPTGKAITIVSLAMRHGLRYGHTADGREISFAGAATKCWVGPAAT
ncbi:hypothetical protein ABT390_34250 [Streptomyces aurantiacus]|uniref:Uncharacterized protein n=1 Tax=Streptomyces aurantiacus JA 4570 TaxID=1286094 RepID=S3ZCP9_9ACTN|nr:hypothetical protein [Streptomyces aurantiacus]EPH41471.1 hypothetical protein STRAU_5475 [Streptomyces aurantiacus JA 4570]